MTDRERWVHTGFLMALVAVMLGFGIAVQWKTVTEPAYAVESCREIEVKRGMP